ncbi:MAG: sigma-E factor regulatory protein RseB domain-containing protein [Vulcanimicrobiaceae bacterium]
MRCRSALAVCTALLALASGPLLADSDDLPLGDPATILHATVVAPQHWSYVGELQITRYSSSRAVATLERVEHLAPASTRRMFLAPEELYGDYVVTRGTTTYEYDALRRRVVISHNPLLAAGGVALGNLARVLQNYRPLVQSTEIIAGRPAIDVLLVNRYTGERGVRIWVDDETGLLLGKEVYHASGAVAEMVRYEELSYTRNLPLSLFSTDAPSGYATVAGHDSQLPNPDLAAAAKQAGFAPVTPQSLPQGFALVGADAATVHGVRSLHLLYSDGLRTLSLFENAAGAATDYGTMRPKPIRIGDRDGEYVEDGPTTLLTWSDRGVAFALVGDLLRDELVAIARSVTV